MLIPPLKRRTDAVPSGGLKASPQELVTTTNLLNFSRKYLLQCSNEDN